MNGVGSKVVALTALLLLVGCGFMVAGAIAAQVDLPLTLSEAITAALQDNPEIQAARNELESAASQITQARSGLLPQVYVSETYAYTNSPLWAFGTKLNQEAIAAADFIPDRLNDPDAIGNYATALSLSWNLFDGGQTWIGWQQSKQNRTATDLGLQRSEQQVIAQTAKAYIGALLAVENRNVVAQALETARAHANVVANRFKSGLAVKSDLLRAQVRIADLEQQHFQADSQVLVAQARLKAAMGRSDDSPLSLVTPFTDCVPIADTLEQWVAKALDQRPELKQLEIHKDIAAKEIAKARSGHWPSLAVQGSYEINSEDFSDTADNYTIGAVVKLNLYSGWRISAQTAAAKARAAKVDSLRRGYVLNVRVETQQAFYQAQSAWQSIAVAEGAVTQADEGLRIVANRYENGLLTIVALLDAQVALQEARTKHFRAMHDYKVARIDLALASGVITKDFH
jgi:outer membrane protein